MRARQQAVLVERRAQRQVGKEHTAHPYDRGQHVKGDGDGVGDSAKLHETLFSVSLRCGWPASRGIE